MKQILFLLLTCNFVNIYAQFSDKQILDFTKKNYLTLLNPIPENKIKEYGFKTKDDIKSVKFSTVIAEYILINNAPVKSNNYRVLALNEKNEPCGLFTVFIKDSNLQLVDYGANELAQNIYNKQKLFSKKAHVSLLRIYVSQSDYLFDDFLKTSNQLFFKVFSTKTYKLSELLKTLK